MAMVKPTPTNAIKKLIHLLDLGELPKNDKQYSKKAYDAAYIETYTKVPNILTNTKGVSLENLLAYHAIIKTNGIIAATKDHKKK